jgi:hypothetical protein
MSKVARTAAIVIGVAAASIATLGALAPVAAGAVAGSIGFATAASAAGTLSAISAGLSIIASFTAPKGSSGGAQIQFIREGASP